MMEPTLLETDSLKRARRIAITVAIGLIGLHIVQVWGYIETPRGDVGRWLHEVDQVARGATPYRGIHWAFPPLSIWLLGGVGRLIGSELIQIWAMTSVIAAAIAVTYALIVTRLAPTAVVAPITAAGLMLGIA